MDKQLRIQKIAYRIWMLTISNNPSTQGQLKNVQRELNDLSVVLGRKVDPALERAPNLPISSYLMSQLLPPLSYQAYRTTATADGERLLQVGEVILTLIHELASFGGPFWTN